MNVTFSFEKNELLQSALTIGGEWNAPFLPHVGDKIDASLLMQWLSPEQLYEALTAEEREMWNSWVESDLEEEMSEKEAWLENYSIWLWHVGSVVSEVVWGNGDNGYHALIVLKGAGM